MSGFNSVNQGFLGGGAGGSSPTTTVPINGLLAATGTNSINNGEYVQQWFWGNFDGLGLSLEAVQTQVSIGGTTLFNVGVSGVISNSDRFTKAAVFQNLHSGPNSTNYGIDVSSDEGTTNIAGIFTAGPNGDNNYAIIVPFNSGNVGLGTSTPSSSYILDAVGNINVNGTVNFNQTSFDFFEYSGNGLIISNNPDLNNTPKISLVDTFHGTQAVFELLSLGLNIQNDVILLSPIVAPAVLVGINTLTPIYELSLNGRLYVEHEGAVLMNVTKPIITIQSYGDTGGYNFSRLELTTGPTFAQFLLKSSWNNSENCSIESDTQFGTSKIGYNANQHIFDNGSNTSLVGINTGTPTETLDVNGNILASGTITPSDIRYKQNIVPIQNGLALINAMQPCMYEYRQDMDRNFNPGNQFGLIAQQLEEILPDLVHTNNTDGFKNINYTGLIPILIQAIQDQQKQINDLKNKN